MALSKMEQQELDQAVKEYLERGGKITICPVNERTEDLEVNVWKRGPGRPKKSEKNS